MNSPAPSALEPADWTKDAACLGYDLKAFFTDDKARVRQAKNVCARCPVRARCLDEVMGAEGSARYGIYGGLTAAERTVLARRT
jgi:WhiB family redox-sensing transcriptional regulator